jgi:hypothetical protein
MSAYSKIFDTNEGQVRVRTVGRPFFIFSRPRTSIWPYLTEASKDFSTFRNVMVSLDWNTADPAVLEKLHEAIIVWVKEVGFARVLEFSRAAQHMENTMRTFAAETPQLRDTALDQQGALLRKLLGERPVPEIYEGIALPLETVKYIRAIW